MLGAGGVTCPRLNKVLDTLCLLRRRGVQVSDFGVVASVSNKAPLRLFLQVLLGVVLLFLDVRV